MRGRFSFKYFLRNINEKHRLSLNNIHDEREVWHMHITPMKAIGVCISTILILFILISTTVAYTPILDLIPGYPGNKSREMLMSSILRLDSMERETQQLLNYNKNVTLVMDGKNPISNNIDRGSDSAISAGLELVMPSHMDSMIRAQLERSKEYKLNTKTNKGITQKGMFSPVDGVVIDEYNPKIGKFGVRIQTNKDYQEVMAADYGTIIYTGWSPVDGCIVQIQHANNLISVYKNLSQQQRKIGDRVDSGEVIGEAEVGGEIIFELWSNGAAVNPEGYVVF